MGYFRTLSVPQLKEMHPWKLIPSAYSGSAVVIVYYGEINFAPLEAEVTGVDGKIMDKNNPMQFIIDPCEAASGAADGKTAKIFIKYELAGVKKKIEKRDIEWTNDDEQDPENTENKKYVLVGSVKLSKIKDSNGVDVTSYQIVSQNLQTNLFDYPNIYVEKDNTDGSGGTGNPETKISYGDENMLQVFSWSQDGGKGPSVSRVTGNRFIVAEFSTNQDVDNTTNVNVDDSGKYVEISVGDDSHIFGYNTSEVTFALRSETNQASLSLENQSEDRKAKLTQGNLEITKNASNSNLTDENLTFSYPPSNQSVLSSSSLTIATLQEYSVLTKKELALINENNDSVASLEIKDENSILLSLVYGYEGGDPNNMIEVATTKNGADGGVMPLSYIRGKVPGGMNFELSAGQQEDGYATLILSSDNDDLSSKLTTQSLKISNGTEEVFIPIAEKPDGTKLSATWKEVTVCADGVTKKMLVLATDPY